MACHSSLARAAGNILMGFEILLLLIVFTKAVQYVSLDISKNMEIFGYLVMPRV
jgi:hypothetical protein